MVDDLVGGFLAQQEGVDIHGGELGGGQLSTELCREIRTMTLRYGRMNWENA